MAVLQNEAKRKLRLATSIRTLGRRSAGVLDQLFARSIALLPAADQRLARSYRDQVVGRAITAVLGACEWELPV